MMPAGVECNDTFREHGVTCPVCGATDATVRFMVWRSDGGPVEQTVIDFECGTACWRPWGSSNELIARAFDRIEA
jgi:hypothetical protein